MADRLLPHHRRRRARDPHAVTRYKNWLLRRYSLGLYLTHNFVSAPATFFRRAALEEAGGFDERYRISVDYDLQLRIARRHDPIVLRACWPASAWSRARCRCPASGLSSASTLSRRAGTARAPRRGALNQVLSALTSGVYEGLAPGPRAAPRGPPRRRATVSPRSAPSRTAARARPAPPLLGSASTPATAAASAARRGARAPRRRRAPRGGARGRWRRRGVPQAIASSGGEPNPSSREGKMRQAARRVEGEQPVAGPAR